MAGMGLWRGKAVGKYRVIAELIPREQKSRPNVTVR